MPERAQSFSSHTRWYAPYHFVVTPILVGTLVVAFRQLAQHPSLDTLWGALVALGVFLGIAVARVQVLTVQNRVIRLEETLRMQRLLPAAQQDDIGKLTVEDFVALRFASDEELPALVRRVANREFSSQKDIKRAIKTWRPDFLRA